MQGNCSGYLKTIGRIVLFSFAAAVFAACEPAPNAQPAQQAQATSTPFPTAPAVARPRYTVVRGDLVNPLEFTGRWQPRDQVTLAFDTNGTVRRVEVRRDDTVSQGQLLADLDIEQLEEQLEDAEFQLQSALAGQETDEVSAVERVTNAEKSLFDAQLALQRHLDTAPSGSMRAAIRGLEDAQRNLEDAEQAYRDALAGHGAGGPGAVDGAYDALEQARRALEDAEFSYREAAQSAGDSIRQWENTRIDLENNLVLAQKNLEDARSGTGTTSSDTIRQTQVTIDRLKQDIAKSTLISPIDGVVLEVRIQPGDTVQAFSGVITLAIPEPREIITNLALGDAQRLSVGKIGICYVDNRPETAVECAVRRIPLSAQDTDQTTRIVASLEDVATPGAVIRVEMPLETRDDVLILPEAAIRTFQNQTFVILDTPDGGRRVNVQIGLRTPDGVEVISGLQEGDVVVGP